MDAEGHAHIEESQLDLISAIILPVGIEAHVIIQSRLMMTRHQSKEDTRMHVNESNLTARPVTDDYIVSPQTRP